MNIVDIQFRKSWLYSSQTSGWARHNIYMLYSADSTGHTAHTQLTIQQNKLAKQLKHNWLLIETDTTGYTVYKQMDKEVKNIWVYSSGYTVHTNLTIEYRDNYITF